MSDALLHGTAQGKAKYPDDPYWDIKEFPTFPDKSYLTEITRVKQFFNPISTAKKAVQKKAAKVRPLSPAELKLELEFHLKNEVCIYIYIYICI